MQNETTLVLGASSDIGREIIRATDARDRKVFAHCYHGKSKLDHLNAELDSTVYPISADLGTVEGSNELIAKVSGSCEVPDSIVILQAPSLKLGRFKNLSRASFQEHFDTQVLGTFDVLKHFLPKMAKRGSGRVVFVLSSVTIGMPPASMANYTTGKYALLGLMRSAAAEYGHKGLSINAISPSMVDTQFLNNLPDKMIELNIAAHIQKRIARVDDIAPAVAFLLSAGANYMNGVNLPIAGGGQV
ncbi:hypothetical protein A9Q99_17565 [Gammaproteobacteria bacterium 45_16_T64]|nr:hypothetical protein A9Q99_17565 [Gammaproteobacteria bacterium 45_16_T64]